MDAACARPRPMSARGSNYGAARFRKCSTPCAASSPARRVLATVSDADNHSLSRPGGAAVPELGQTAAVMVGDLWRWGMRGEIDAKRFAEIVWRQLVRWLVADVPSRVARSRRKRQRAATNTRAVGGHGTRDEGVQAGGQCDTSSLPFGPGTAFRTGRGRLPRAEHDVAATNFIQITADASPSQPGSYEATYIARDAGAYSVDAVVTQPDGKEIGHASAGWASDPASEEFHSLKPNRALMETPSRSGRAAQVLTMEGLREFRAAAAGTARAHFGAVERTVMAKAGGISFCAGLLRRGMGHTPLERIAVKSARLYLLRVAICAWRFFSYCFSSW